MRMRTPSRPRGERDRREKKGGSWGRRSGGDEGVVGTRGTSTFLNCEAAHGRYPQSPDCGPRHVGSVKKPREQREEIVEARQVKRWSSRPAQGAGFIIGTTQWWDEGGRAGAQGLAGPGRTCQVHRLGTRLEDPVSSVQGLARRIKWCSKALQAAGDSRQAHGVAEAEAFATSEASSWSVWSESKGLKRPEPSAGTWEHVHGSLGM